MEKLEWEPEVGVGEEYMSARNIERLRMEAVLKRHGVWLKKKYGQNFLSDPDILRRIVEAAGVSKEDFVLEIGPGMGSLTRELSKAAGGVLAVEIDEKLMPVLEEQLADCFRVELICGDIMKLSISDLVESRAEGRPVKVVANLPYYITTPILMKVLEEDRNWSSLTVMVQREVAERMTAGPGTKTYGALSIAVAYYARPHVDFYLPPEAFFPPPKVESAVITLERRTEPPVTVADEALLFSLIRASFNQRRKTLVNGLAHGAGLPLSKEEIAEAVEEVGLPKTVRGEALSLAQFAEVAEVIGGRLGAKGNG